MKLATVRFEGEERVGAVEGPAIRLFPREAGDMVDLARNGVPACGTELTSLSDVRVLAPIRRFRRDVLCTGWNYWDHFEEGIGKRTGRSGTADRAHLLQQGTRRHCRARRRHRLLSENSAKWDYEAELP